MSGPSIRSTAAVAVGLLGLGTLVGCGEEEGGAEAPGFSVSDSAGVEIVRIGAGAGGEDDVPLLSIREDLRIGSLDGPAETQFHLVRTTAVAPDGAIFVPLLGANEIRVFDSEGAHVATLGREGQGPGEFQGLSRVHVTGRGDTVVALDARLRRVTTMTRDGEVLSTATLPMPQEGLTGLISPAARIGDAWVVTAQVPYDWPEHGRHVNLESRLVLVPGEPDVGEALRRVEAAAGRGMVNAGGGPGAEAREVGAVLGYRRGRMYGMRMGEALTGQRALWDPTQSWAADGAGRLHVTGAEEYRIDTFDGEGRLLRRVYGPHRPVPITAHHRERFLAEAEAHHDTTDRPTEFGTDPMERERFRIELPMPEHFQPLGRILASDEGALLVERPDLVEDPVALEWSQLGRQESRWDLFDPDGRLLGRVGLPPTFTPHVLAEDWIVGAFRDDLGVEYVVRYRLG